MRERRRASPAVGSFLIVLGALGVACANGGTSTGTGPYDPTSDGGDDSSGGDDGGGPCTSQSCKGCCNGSMCVAGTSDMACGTGGSMCHDCSQAGMKCKGGTCTFGCNNCTTGCCDSVGTCQSGTIDTSCGSGGRLCQNCTKQNETCSGGACQCGAGCAGCCQGNMCVAGMSNTACGFGGTQCQDCTQVGSTCSAAGGCL